VAGQRLAVAAFAGQFRRMFGDIADIALDVVARGLLDLADIEELQPIRAVGEAQLGMADLRQATGVGRACPDRIDCAHDLLPLSLLDSSFPRSVSILALRPAHCEFAGSKAIILSTTARVACSRAFAA